MSSSITPTIETPGQSSSGKQVGAPNLTNDSFFRKEYKVKQDFAWTLNKNKNVRDWVPGIYLTQYDLTRSGELGSIYNTILGVGESFFATQLVFQRTFQNAREITADIARAYGAVKGSSRATAIADVLDSPAAKLATGVTAAADGAAFKNALGEKYVYAPYRGLYPAKKTGFVYVLPYLNIENMTESAGAWRPADESNFTANVGNVAGMIAAGPVGEETAKRLINITGGEFRNLKSLSQLEVALTAPGSAQEKIKSFAPNDTGDNINLSFYLYNTESIQDIRDNWEFLFNLTYQNLPNRKSINKLDPPCVYEVVVPGYKRFPVAVIDTLKVTNLGTTRLINIETGEIQGSGQAGGNSQIKIIPEAYKVDIKITSLLTNTRNLYYSAYKSTPVNVNTNPVLLEEEEKK